MIWDFILSQTDYICFVTCFFSLIAISWWFNLLSTDTATLDRAPIRLPKYWFSITILLILTIGWWFTDYRGTIEAQRLRSNILAQTTAIAQAIDPEVIKLLSLSESDLNTRQYQQLRDQLTAFGQSLPNIRWLYAMTKVEDRVVFVLDLAIRSTDDESDNAKPGEVYAESSKELVDLFSTGDAFTEGPLTDRWGTFVSAFSPVYDAQKKKIVMAVGIDIEASNYDASIRDVRLYSIASIMLLVVTLLGGRIFLRVTTLTQLGDPTAYRNSETYLNAVVGVVITIILTAYFRENERNQEQVIAQHLSNSLAIGISETFRNLRDNTTANLTEIIGVDTQMSRSSFRSFASSIIRYSPFLGIGWAPFVSSSDRNKFEQNMAKEGLANFSIFQRDSLDSAFNLEKDRYFLPTTYFEPDEGIRDTIGMDLKTDPARSPAILNAIETGLPSATNAIRNDANQEVVVEAYLPSFDKPHLPSSKTPQTDPRGVAYLRLNLDILMQTSIHALLKKNEVGQAILYQLDVGKDPQFIASSLVGNEELEFHNSSQKPASLFPLFFFDKTYGIETLPGNLFSSANPTRSSWICAIAGLFITSIISFFVYLLANRKACLAQQVIERTEELHKMASRAERANAAKSEFLAKMSHEIRTPLSGVIGITDLLKETNLDEDQAAYVSTAHSCSKTLLALVNDILDFSKIEAQKFDLVLSNFDFLAMVKSTSEMLSILAEKKSNSLFCNIDPEIPTMLKGDPVCLRRILTNLVSNAIKFTQAGNITIDIGIAEETESTCTLTIRVSDNGIGISEKASSKLFSPFTQGDNSSTRVYGGTGLGLVISKQLVEKMGGQIGFESSEGKGTTFWCSVTLGKVANRTKNIEIDCTPRKANLPNDQSLCASNLPSADTLSTKEEKTRILIADDNSINQILLGKMLQNLGFQTDLVSDGLEALDAIRKKTYSIILMDCEMPNMDGTEATMAIRRGSAGESNTTIPIVAVTASASVEDRERCLKCGMNDYLTKPLDIQELRRLVLHYTKDIG